MIVSGQGTSGAVPPPLGAVRTTLCALVLLPEAAILLLHLPLFPILLRGLGGWIPVSRTIPWMMGLIAGGVALNAAMLFSAHALLFLKPRGRKAFLLVWSAYAVGILALYGPGSLDNGLTDASFACVLFSVYPLLLVAFTLLPAVRERFAVRCAGCGSGAAVDEPRCPGCGLDPRTASESDPAAKRRNRGYRVSRIIALLVFGLTALFLTPGLLL